MGLVSALDSLQFSDGNSMKIQGCDKLYDIGVQSMGERRKGKSKPVF